MIRIVVLSPRLDLGNEQVAGRLRLVHDADELDELARSRSISAVVRPPASRGVRT
jgi:hypothetical protein